LEALFAMNTMLDLYKATAERETGFWIDLPVATGQVVSRDEWLTRMKEDPEHFQIATLTDEELTGESTDGDGIIEHAVFVAWSDEKLQ
jgi:hypothetical protein